MAFQLSLLRRVYRYSDVVAILVKVQSGWGSAKRRSKLGPIKGYRKWSSSLLCCGIALTVSHAAELRCAVAFLFLNPNQEFDVGNRSSLFEFATFTPRYGFNDHR